MYDIRRTIGRNALDAVFTEGYLLHPNDPDQGAVVARARLHERYGEQMRDITPHFAPTRSNAQANA